MDYHDYVHHSHGDCSCNCFTCLYKIDIILILIVVYLIFVDKIHVNTNTMSLPLLPVDERQVTPTETPLTSPSISPDSGIVLFSGESTVDIARSTLNSPPESLPESVNSNGSGGSLRRKLIKPDISLSFLDSSDEDDFDDEDDATAKTSFNEDDYDNCVDNNNFYQDTSQCEENFANSRIRVKEETIKSSSVKSSCLHHHESHSDDEDSREPWIALEPGPRSLPCSLDNSILVHEALEVNLPYNLSLTFRELGHIRKALAREELDSIGFARSIKEEIRRGKLCSTCLKTRFRLFGPWPVRCKLCERPVCTRCSSLVQISSSSYNRIPVKLLVPNSGFPSQTSCQVHLQNHQQHCNNHQHNCQKFKSNADQRLTNIVDNNNDKLDLPAITYKDQANGGQLARISFRQSLSWIPINRKYVDEPSLMVIKLCLDCEMFFLTLLTVE